MSLKRYDGSSFVDVKDLRRYNNSSWVDCEYARRYDGSSWKDVWPEGEIFCTPGNVKNIDGLVCLPYLIIDNGGPRPGYGDSTEPTRPTFHEIKEVNGEIFVGRVKDFFNVVYTAYPIDLSKYSKFNFEFVLRQCQMSWMRYGPVTVYVRAEMDDGFMLWSNHDQFILTNNNANVYKPIYNSGSMFKGVLSCNCYGSTMSQPEYDKLEQLVLNREYISVQDNVNVRLEINLEGIAYRGINYPVHIGIGGQSMNGYDSKYSDYYIREFSFTK